ncbi:MAG: M14 family metallopeptidase, partial [Phycisphaerales bacterium]
YADSHEKRTLYYLTITSPANHARLDQIRKNNAKLADPRKLKNAREGDGIVKTMPAVAWMAYNIHGDELSSTDAAMTVAYLLAAGTDAETRALLDQLVIHIDPLMNPDGRERYLAQLQTLQGKVPNTDYQAMQHGGLWSAGRGNHYLFDLNRDWLMQVHPETRGRAAVIRAWNPHLVVDSHEMGSLDTYLFDPPREPLNIDISQSSLAWRVRFSADQAAAFDQHGWSYYTREWYEEWYPGYTNAWAGLRGAVGLLYEQAGVNAAAVKQPAGQILTYADAVHHHVVSSLANLETLRANRQEILADYLADQRWAVSDQGNASAALILPAMTDWAKRDRFLDLLTRQGIEFHRSPLQFTATGVTDVWGQTVPERAFPEQTIVVPMQQPNRRSVSGFLGFDPHMSDDFLKEERTELENRRGSRLYDVTGWNIPMAYGLDAYWAERISRGRGANGAPPPGQLFGNNEQDAYGYLIDGQSSDLYSAIVQLIDQNCKLRVASKPFAVGGQTYDRGTVLLRGHENPGNIRELLQEVRIKNTLIVEPVATALSESGPDLGGQRFHLLEQPRVAIASQWPISTTSFGSTWFLFDARTGLRVSPINIQSLGGIDLRNYNVLVLPDVWGSGALRAVLNESTITKIEAWVKSGGTLIAMGGSASFLASEEIGLSSVRLRRDVLGELDVYEEAMNRERSARMVQIDPDEVWGHADPIEEESPTTDEGDKVPEKSASPKDDELERLDQWQRIFSPRGAIVASELDREHWLCFGLDDRLPVLLSGQFAYMSSHPVATPVRLADSAHLRLSGLLWPEAKQRSADTAYATVERLGNGQVILFATDPFFRGYYEGSGRLLLNAVILGPGMGASQPNPW